MKNVKKVMLAVGVMALSISFIGCGNKSTTNKETETKETTSAGFVNVGNGDNYAVDIFTDGAAENTNYVTKKNGEYVTNKQGEKYVYQNVTNKNGEDVTNKKGQTETKTVVKKDPSKSEKATKKPSKNQNTTKKQNTTNKTEPVTNKQGETVTDKKGEVVTKDAYDSNSDDGWTDFY